MKATGKTILLVEDEAITAMAETARLTKEGYGVVHVPSGEEAIQHEISITLPAA